MATDAEKNPGEFVCRRFPPQVPTLNISQFPSVKGEWWCGEHRSRARAIP